MEQKAESPKPCLTCEFNEKVDSELSGVVWQTDFWRVEHSVGNSAGVGAMVVKLKRHAEWLGELTREELVTLGPCFGKSNQSNERSNRR